MRHGQSEANLNHIWQGLGSSPLTAKGRRQAKLAGVRLQKRELAMVVSSDLERAADSARIAGFEPDQRSVWREGDLGKWEGLTFNEVMDQYGDDLHRLNNGEELKLGGTGESGREVSDRALEGVEEILAELGDGETALIVTHGGLINGLVRRILSVPGGGRRLGIPANSSFTQLTFDGVDASDRMLVSTFNDAAHLEPVNDWTRQHLANGFPVIEFIRHGQTDANVMRRMQGHADWGLNDVGRAQAARLAPHLGLIDAAYTSSLGRASETADVLFDQMVTHSDALREIDMGEWNGMLFEEVPRDEYYNRLFVELEDVPRGHTGERWSELVARASAFVLDTAPNHPGERVGMVSHGGTIRAFLGASLGLDQRTIRRHLGFLSNTAVSQAVMLADGPMVTAYNVAGHLED